MGKFEYPPTPASVSNTFEGSDWVSPSHSQHVAIVGMSCRTAGGNNTPEKLWKFLMEKKNASGEVPKKRWEPWLRRDPRNAKVMEKTTTKGYFIDHLELFDAAFFGISPKEAELMDPHQRLGLELAWESLEDAGLDPKKLAGSDTAVFMGVDSDDYSRLILEDLPNIEAWSGIGTAYHGIPNRISYHLDLMGPSTAVDAACASSLIAIHLGRQAILSGESTVALCGGVNVLCAPGLTHMLDKAGALSPDGVCLSFDDDAHGYARGEGGAIAVLKRLSSAIADGDNILAVLKGSATAQDGKTNGIMAPNAKAQEMVARQALSRAGGMDPSTIGYVEAHATSTSLGDPTEVGAISNVYGVGRSKDSPCAIGSIKPNIGHLEAAAGAISFVKAVLAVNKGELAPQALLQNLNSKIDWENSGLRVVREPCTWPESSSPRRAAICSYGYGGSVSHAVIEQAPLAHSATQAYEKAHADEEDEEKEETNSVLITMSAFQEKRLSGQANMLADWIESDGKAEKLQAIARTLAQRRAPQDYRLSFVADSHDEVARALREFAEGKLGQWVSTSRVLGNGTNKDVVWVFSGHGAQWPGMGKELLDNAVFRQSVMELDWVIEREAGFSPLEALQKGDVGDSDRVQVLTYVVQIGLAKVLRSKGVEPQAIVGHSVGEIAASVAAGCLTAEEGALVVSRRAKLYAQIKGQGGMALVHLPFRDVLRELGGRRDIVAAINSSPSSCVVSGELAALEQYLTDLDERGVKAFRVRTDIPFHSPMLERLVGPLTRALASVLQPRLATVPIYSTSNTNPRTDSLRNTDYWTCNMVYPVQLHEAVEAAVEDGYRVFLEVSTHPIVTHSIDETLAAKGVDESATLSVMKRDVSAERSIMHAISQLNTLGASVDFAAQQGTRPWATTMPNTRWVQKPYWKEVETGIADPARRHDMEKHTLLGQRIDMAGTETCLFTTTLDDRTKPYPLQHPLDGTEIVPAAVYCNTFHQATGATILDGLELRVPLSMTADVREVQVIRRGDLLQLSSRLTPSQTTPDALQHAWIDHGICKWGKPDMATLERRYDISEVKARIGTRLANSFAWDFLQNIGVSGIAYPWAVLEHYGNDKEMIVKMDMDPEKHELEWDSRSWAPFLDAATSVGSSIFFNSPKMRIVSGIDQVQFVSADPPPKVGYLYVEEVNDDTSLAADISLLSEQGHLLAKLKSMRFSDVEASSSRTTGVDALVHRIAWIPPPFAERPLDLEHVLLISRDATYADEMKSHIHNLVEVASVDEMDNPAALHILSRKGAFAVYVPGRANTFDEVPEKAHAFVWEAACILNKLATLHGQPKLFVITDRVYKSQEPTALAHAPLYGFARIAAQEHPELWGGLIDNEGGQFPLLAIKYVQEQDVIRMQDGLPRIARMRPFSKSQHHDADPPRTLLPICSGTYVITGGFGHLGVQVVDFLVSKGARRIVVVSRRSLPPRSQWTKATGQMQGLVNKIRYWEDMGATIHAFALDIGAPDAHERLRMALDGLSLPPVAGVVHAAGLSEDGLIRDTTSDSFARVLSPKVAGALALHKTFPPTTLDFFILFSSIGQLVGTSGQSPYGAANAFLDALATHRRGQGDNAIALQWTAWRGMGLAADSEFLTMELSSKGITDITCEEGFQAWEHLSSFDTDHAVVTRARILDADEPIPYALVAEVAPRRAPVATATSSSPSASYQTTSKPVGGAELKAWLSTKIKEAIGAVLHLDPDEIDARAAIADLGVDSVMTVSLRQKLQSVMGVKVPSTLTWNHPTVGHLTEWFYAKEESSE